MTAACPRCGFVPVVPVHLEVLVGAARDRTQSACGAGGHGKRTTDPKDVTCGRCLVTVLYQEALV